MSGFRFSGLRFVGLALPAALLLVACEPQTDQQGGQMDTDEPMTEQQQPTTDDARTEQRTVAFAEWDRDGDERLGPEEFRTWWTEEGPIDDWGFDEQDEISRDDMGSQLFETWDRDGDGSLGEAEFRDHADRWFEGEIDADAWSQWDADGNGELDEEEFTMGLESQGVLDGLDSDGDGMITSQDLADRYFEALDLDGDGSIDSSEWESAQDGGLDG